MRNTLLAVLVAALVPWSTARAEVRVTMADGQVSVSAKNATVSQILAEWARVGQTRIVNAERLPGGPTTIELTDMPEAQALDIILRGAGGYLAATRAVSTPTASKFDRILVLPVGTATPGPRAAGPGATPTPSFQPPRPALPTNRDDEPNDAPAFRAFPQPEATRPPGSGAEDAPLPPAPSPVLTAPVGVARPGMLMPAPPAPAAPPSTNRPR